MSFGYPCIKLAGGKITVRYLGRAVGVDSVVARAEGPAVSSPARQGGVFKTFLRRGPKDRHSACAAPSALYLTHIQFPASRPGLLSVGLSGLNCSNTLP
jgi:hypothetical protein